MGTLHMRIAEREMLASACTRSTVASLSANVHFVLLVQKTVFSYQDAYNAYIHQVLYLFASLPFDYQQ